MSTTSNPYASPESLTDPFAIDEPVANTVHYASQNKRFVNFIVDGILTRIIGGVLGFALGFAYAASVIADGRSFTPQDETFLNIVGTLMGLVVVIVYYVVAEGIFAITPGKFLTGTQVVNESGGKPRLAQIFGRTLARFIPFEPFSFLFGEKTTGWHDSLSGTRVIDVRAARRAATRS